MLAGEGRRSSCPKGQYRTPHDGVYVVTTAQAVSRLRPLIKPLPSFDASKLFRDQRSARRWRRGGSGRREYERGPYVPTLGSVLGAELLVSFEIEVALVLRA